MNYEIRSSVETRYIASLHPHTSQSPYVLHDGLRQHQSPVPNPYIMIFQAKFRLKVEKIEQKCRFELSWNQAQQLKPITLSYPQIVINAYQEWREAYLSFYQTELRGRIGKSGSLRTDDPRQKLKQTEVTLLSYFHSWLQSQELSEIRTAIANTGRNLAEQISRDSKYKSYCIDLCLTCSPLELERLPWEAWEIGKELGMTGKIHISRTPVQIQGETLEETQKQIYRKPRILVILGDNTGLNFQEEKKAVRKLTSLAEIHFCGWQKGQDLSHLKTRVIEKISDEQGWDILLFFGHSNENQLVGGEIAIAPGITLSINELTNQLKIAKNKGLKFALFNSCSGLNIASSLIDLGLSQVAVMREPIHNKVAQDFLIRFLQALSEYKDVHDALLEACMDLKQNFDLTYPSAYLIPSLFCHPASVLFRLQPRGIRQTLKHILPTKEEAIALAIFIPLSVFPPIQDILLNNRLGVQAFYRDITTQLPLEITPSVTLVQIDTKSFSKAGITDPKPIDYRYLASIINKLSEADVKIIGIDYLLDTNQNTKNSIITNSIRNAIEKKETWFIFASITTEDREEKPRIDIANPNWSLYGDIVGLPQYVRLSDIQDCDRSCPFTYLLSIAYTLNRQPAQIDLPQPKLKNRDVFQDRLFSWIERQKIENNEIAFLHQLKNLFPTWLQPINDFSIPPNRVYNRIAAWDLLNRSAKNLKQLSLNRQIVIIAPGGYTEAGIDAAGEDNFPVPLGVKYWRERLAIEAANTNKITGSEAHAYTISHLLTRRLVILVPDFWLVIIAIFLGKVTIIILKQYYRQKNKKWWLFGFASTTVFYPAIALQMYISVGVLIPWLLPSTIITIYLWLFLRRKPHV
jgi:CHASE2 domain